MDGIFLEALGPIVQVICEGIFYVLRACWRAYARVLSFPVLAAVTLDCIGGFVGALSLMKSASVGLSLLGFGLAVGIPVFFLASMIAWSFKVLRPGEEDRYPRLPARP